MAARKPPNRIAKGASARDETATAFTADERAAIRERAAELKTGARGSTASDESAVLETIAAMSPADQAMATRLHALITTTAPSLSPRLWYGMPAYARDGNVVCFFQGARKFKTRYSTLGFSDKAALDDGEMWPTSYALEELTTAVEARIAALVKRAVG